MYHAAREAARTMAVQEATASEGVTKAETLLSSLNLDFTVTASKTGSDAIVEISVDKDRAALGDPLQVFPVGNLTSRVTMLVED